MSIILRLDKGIDKKYYLTTNVDYSDLDYYKKNVLDIVELLKNLKNLKE